MDRKFRGRARRMMSRGMTLVEIMVVVAIIGMLMGTVGVYAYGQLEKARVKDTKLVIHNVQEALVHYQTDNTDCPKTVQDLVTQKYMLKEPKDGWNRPLIFVCPGTHNPDGADITSLGKDGKEGGDGTNADIHSWDM